MNQTKKIPVHIKDIFKGFPLPYLPTELPEISISGIAIDSRKVIPGDIFIARRGGSLDGHTFIPKAIELGAACIVGEKELENLPIPYIRVPDSVRAVTWLAAGFYNQPGSRLTVIGVTGTDGKTTTSNLIHRILQISDYKAGLISTVNAVIGDMVLDTGFHVTTPDAHDVQYYLAKMVEAGLTHVILETTSHGLAQHRVDASQYDMAVFTNITHEHLDQHGSYESYRVAKGRLIELLGITGEKNQGNPRLGVINRDDSSFSYLQELARKTGPIKICSYGKHPEAEYQAVNIHCSNKGIQFDAVGKQFRIPISSRLVGEFNVLNILAALVTAIEGFGMEPEAAVKGIAAMSGIPGRMETISMGQRFAAMVDFAHTPNALRSAIHASRSILGISKNEENKKGSRIIVVFGSAGLRDREKRRLMAETSIELADISVFTAEDPRTESLTEIIGEMAEGARSNGGKEGETFYCIPDRGTAIQFACQIAEPGDIVLVCGKGHEQSMCFGEIEYPWDDRIAVQAALAELLGIPGPQMPYLPTQESPDG